jgi:hypothetical protein
MMTRASLFLICAVALNAAVSYDGPGGQSASRDTSCGSTASPTGVCTITVSCVASAGTNADIQTAANNAARGDTIKLEAGCVWTSATAEAVWLYNPPGSSGYVTITTTADDKLPASNTRITPAYTPLLPTVDLTASNGPFFAVSASNDGPARQGGTPASHWRFVGIRLTSSANIYGAQGGNSITNGIVRVGSIGQMIIPSNLVGLTVSGGVATFTTFTAHGWKTDDVIGVRGTDNADMDGLHTITVTSTTQGTFTTAAGDGDYNLASAYLETPPAKEYQPDDIVFDRVLGTQTNWLGRVRRIIFLNGRQVEIKNSFLEGSQDESDSQTVNSINGSGPYIFENNHIGGATENIMFGGSTNTINEPATGSVIQYNYFPHTPERHHSLKWDLLKARGVGGYCPGGGLVFTGRHTRASNHKTDYVANNSSYIATTSGCVGETEPDWSTCTSGFACTVTDGDIIWRRYGTPTTSCGGPCPGGAGSSWSIKNNLEIKGSKDMVVSHNVFEYMWVGGQETAINLKSEQQAKAVYNNNCVPTGYGTVNATGTTVTFVSGFQFPYQTNWSNTWSINALSIVIDGTTYTIASFDSATQLTLTTPVTGSPLSGVAFSYGAPRTIMCIADWNWNTTFSNNIVRNVSRPFKINPGTNARRDLTSGLILRNNLFTDSSLLYWANVYGESETSSNGWAHWYSGPLVAGAVIENNTWIRSVNLYAMDVELNAAGFGATQNPRDTVMRGNVISGGSSGGLRAGSVTTEHPTLIASICGGGAATCPTSQWDKNILAGVTKTSYATSPGSVSNLCAGNAGCSPTWTNVYPQYDRRKYIVGNATAFKRADHNGRDYGVDVSQLAEIRNLSVTPSDRMVLFSWNVSIPIRDIPCVVEVNTKPWFDPAYYAGEQSPAQIANYPRYDADDHDRNPRRGLARQIVVGHTVNLAASTLYHYRLQCGGDTRTGEFTTLGTLAGTGTLQTTGASASSMTWGYSYSRDTGTISGGGSGSCADSVCTATADKGKVLYWRHGSGVTHASFAQ